MDRRKRLLDAILSLLALASLAPIWLLISIAIWLEDGRPILFKQKRLGRSGRIFTVYKFRKLSHPTPGCDPSLGTAIEPPYTRVGWILEATKLNEIPQLVNVAKGEMSMVGPRPEVPEFKHCFSGPYRRLLDYIPGIFGPSQCAFRNEAAMYPAGCDKRSFYEQVLFPQKAKIDLQYYPWGTMGGDLRWMYRSVSAVLCGILQGRDSSEIRAQPLYAPLAGPLRITRPEKPVMLPRMIQKPSTTESTAMRAVILAGGKGRRLAPYTIAFPKPMVPVGDMPILEIVIRQLKQAGFTHITMAVGHLAELLMAYFQDGSRWGVHIDYSREEAPLGTSGPLLLLEDLPEHFLVMNGDVLTTLNYADLLRFHMRTGSVLTIACHRCNTKVDLGVIEFDGRMQVTGYREKPTIPYDVSMGVYIFNRRALANFAPGTYLDLPAVVEKLIEQNQPVKVYLSDTEWLDIGRPSDYEIASVKFQQMRDQFLSSDQEQEQVLEAAQ
jgi:lipopolysaccharide/colanic/teichoic acid biosynthesis glycosyltransferase/dTDP-glucose pyrophosphorylase